MAVGEVKISSASRRHKLLYMQVADRLREAVANNKYDAGQKLPSLQALSVELGVNHLTVRRGIESLLQEGLLAVRPRVGVFVSDKHLAPRTVTRTSPRLVLAVRTYLQSEGVPHPAVAAYLAGMHSHMRASEVAFQTMFYRAGGLVAQCGQALLDQQIDGIIISDGGTIPEDHAFLRRNKLAVVDCSLSPPSDARVFRLVRSSGEVVRLAVEHLRSLAHRRIAFLCWRYPGDQDQARSAFSRLVVDHQLGNPRELLVEVDNPEHAPRWEEIEKLFDLDPLPTAVIVHDDMMADRVLAACARRGISVPGQLSVVSMTDASPNAHRIPLTAPDSVVQSIAMMRLAVDKLLDQIEGRSLTETSISIPVTLVMKASSGPARAAQG